MDETNFNILQSLLERHEGVEQHPYTDTVGKVTIGIGRNLTDVGLRTDEISYLFRHDVHRAERCLRGYVFFAQIEPYAPRWMALIDMMFTLGPGGFAKFKKMLAALAKGDWDTAAHEMLDSQWATQVGGRAEELAAMVRSDQLPSWLEEVEVRPSAQTPRAD